MDNNIFDNDSIVGNGIPYNNITWQDVPGNPFGKAANFNAFIFGDANNIVDMKGAFAIGGSFYSPRGLSLNFGRNIQSPEYTPDNVGFLVGRNVAMNGSLVVVGHVVVGGGFRAARGSTFLIGKDGSPKPAAELAKLYASNGQSRYWSPSDRGSHYIISSYDVPHYLPASRINANLSAFFQDAKNSIVNYKECIEDMPVNGVVEEDFHEWVLTGDDPDLNIFILDRRPNGLISKGIRFDVPDTSTIIVRLKTGVNAHLQYGLLGSKEQASRTIYLFEDATNIYMEVPADIWGSFLAPQAMLHGHRTGGHITGNVALNSFAVSATSGFEFHFPVFEGQVLCEDISDIIFERPDEIPIPPEPIVEEPEPIIPEPIVEVPEPIIPEPIATVPEPVVPIPMPARPPKQERPTPILPGGHMEPVIPSPITPRPIERPMPSPRPCPPCPEPRPFPPCLEPIPCPPCPEPEPCPEPKTYTKYIPYPVRMPNQLQEPMPCQKCPECLIEEGVISGCIWGCECCKNHGWRIELYEICNNEKLLVNCIDIGHYGCFKFYVPYDGCYSLSSLPIGYRRSQPYFYKKGSPCKPIMSLNNIGVSNFYY